MTKSCLKRITPDALTGMIFALEGMRGAVVLLNGPMGCRFYHSTTSQFLSVRPMLTLPTESGRRVPVDYNYLNDWFFRQERVPCTYLDGYDYVYGTKEKVAEALAFIRQHVAFDLLAIVNSPGAALIGDELLTAARAVLPDRNVMVMASPTFSAPFEQGYAEACRALLEQVPADTAPKRDGKRRVNLLGLSIWHRYYEGDLAELRRLFALCGIEVNAALCADCTVQELRAVSQADLSVVLIPEMGELAAGTIREKYGVPVYTCPTLPVGFAATERMIADICRLLHVPDAPVLEESKRARARAWYAINQVHVTSGKPRGVTFCVDGSPSQEKAYTEFLTRYLGMAPAPPEEAELVLGDANLIAELMLKNKRFCGIEISLPGMGYLDLVPKTHLGIRGASFLIEQVLNALMSRLD